MPALLEHRIDELEIRVAHQERTIADLNDVITAQWKKIELLERRLQRLGEEMEAMESAEAHPITKPPHY